MRKLIAILLLFAGTHTSAQQHPVAFATKADLMAVKNNLSKNVLLKQSYADIKKSVDKWIGKDIDVPIPKDPAGGYTHEKHKENYTLMFNSGLLFQITGDTRYAELVKGMFKKYAVLNPTLKNHPEATSSSPGRIFWQALNDANWLVYAGLAFDCIHNYLAPEERKQIAAGAFKPLVDYFTIDIKSWFNLIHNHAVWACAGVGIVGIATDNEEYVQMALYGSNKDGKAGLIAHLDGLFSPDGYYNEGPYYTRYAVLPFFLFANAVNNTKPQLKIFQHRDKILKKALDGALQQTNLNGGFYSYNDALKDKTYTSNELVVAINIAWQVYGVNNAYLPVAKAQGRVVLNKGGVGISEALQRNKNIAAYYPYRSIEFTDGAKGDEGGVSILRSGNDNNLTSLIYKYSSHGLSHGHYDKLNINLFDEGNEVLTDYGAVRFISIEQKWGGRYLPETKTYAQQTIAHNTLTVDETSHFKGVEKESEKYHPTRLFGTTGNHNVQVVSAFDDKAYSDVQMHRTVYMVQLPDAEKPLIIDFFRALSPSVHQYDLPFNYSGSVISTNFKYTPFTSSLPTVGTKNGYQHIWKEAEATIHSPFSQFTFLNSKTFYSISSLINDSARIFFTRTGARDPNFNLRREPSYIIRTKGGNQLFVNVIEIHGSFSPMLEVSSNAYSGITKIEKLADDENYSAASITVKGKTLWLIQANKDFKTETKHGFQKGSIAYSWTGPYCVVYDGKQIK
ncbi:MAG: alginate lyase family protein [Chitinophagaceae bacterium]